MPPRFERSCADHLYTLLKEAPAAFIFERISGDCLQRVPPMRTLTAASADAMSCSRKVSLGSSSPSATIGIVGPSCSKQLLCATQAVLGAQYVRQQPRQQACSLNGRSGHVHGPGAHQDGVASCQPQQGAHGADAAELVRRLPQLPRCILRSRHRSH